MPYSDGDPAIRAALERQLALLAPVAESLRAARTGPAPLVSDDWRGPAAEAAARFLDDLDTGMREAVDLADDTVRRLRVLVATL